MFPQAFPSLQSHSGEATIGFYDLATGFFIPTVYDDHVLMGNIAYDFLANEANSGQYSYGLFGYSSFVDDIHGTVDDPTLSSTHAGYTTSPITITPYDTLLFPPSPSPSLSQSSSTSEPDEASPSLSRAPKSSCHRATPVFNYIRKKWSCNMCNKCFRGRWECKRHIGVIGKRAKCLVCRGVLSGREDSLRRHFKKYCKGNVRGLKFEDAFIQV